MKLLLLIKKKIPKSLLQNSLYFILGILVWMFIDVYITKGIDSSFISATTDTVLAILAVLAIIKAKDFWKEKSKQDGYLLAKKIHNEHFINSVMFNDLFHPLNILRSRANYLSIFYSRLEDGFRDEGEKEEVLLISRLSDLYDNLSDHFYTKTFPHSKEVDFDIFRMKASEVDFSNNINGKMLSEHFELYSEFATHLGITLNYTANLLDLFYKNDFDNESTKKDISPPTYRRDLKGRAKQIHNLSLETLEIQNKMKINLEKGIKREIKISQCFSF